MWKNARPQEQIIKHTNDKKRRRLGDAELHEAISMQPPSVSSHTTTCIKETLDGDANLNGTTHSWNIPSPNSVSFGHVLCAAACHLRISFAELRLICPGVFAEHVSYGEMPFPNACHLPVWFHGTRVMWSFDLLGGLFLDLLILWKACHLALVFTERVSYRWMLFFEYGRKKQ